MNLNYLEDDEWCLDESLCFDSADRSRCLSFFDRLLLLLLCFLWLLLLLFFLFFSISFSFTLISDSLLLLLLLASPSSLFSRLLCDRLWLFLWRWLDLWWWSRCSLSRSDFEDLTTDESASFRCDEDGIFVLSVSLFSLCINLKMKLSLKIIRKNYKLNKELYCIN